MPSTHARSGGSSRDRTTPGAFIAATSSRTRRCTRSDTARRRALPRLACLVWRFLQDDVLLVARLIAAAGALAFIAMGGPSVLALVAAGLLFLFMTSAMYWGRDLVRECIT